VAAIARHPDVGDAAADVGRETEPGPEERTLGPRRALGVELRDRPALALVAVE